MRKTYKKFFINSCFLYPGHKNLQMGDSDGRYFSLYIFILFSLRTCKPIIYSQIQAIIKMKIQKREQPIHWSWGTLNLQVRVMILNLGCINYMISFSSSKISDQFPILRGNSKNSNTYLRARVTPAGETENLSNYLFLLSTRALTRGMI